MEMIKMGHSEINNNPLHYMLQIFNYNFPNILAPVAQSV
jgi:hypothetical protein